MAKSLNYNSIKKQYLTVTLADEKQTTIMIGTPTKSDMDELKSLQGVIESLGEDTDSEKMDVMFTLCARLMSRNKGGIEITKEKIEDIFDLEDIVIFFHAYQDFLSEVMGGKN